jgi:hypothetical protein
MPKYQVSRFQPMAPRTGREHDAQALLAGRELDQPLPTVAATLAPKWVPTKLPSAAIRSATRGVSARVETLVAIALAASWKPFV